MSVFFGPSSTATEEDYRRNAQEAERDLKRVAEENELLRKERDRVHAQEIEIERARKMSELMTRERQELNTGLSKLRSEIKSLSLEHQATRQEKEELEDQLAHVTDILNSVMANGMELSATNNELLQKKKKLESDLESCNVRIRQEQEALEKTNIEKLECMAKLTTSQAERDALHGEHNALVKEKEDMEAQKNPEAFSMKWSINYSPIDALPFFFTALALVFVNSNLSNLEEVAKSPEVSSVAKRINVMVNKFIDLVSKQGWNKKYYMHLVKQDEVDMLNKPAYVRASDYGRYYSAYLASAVKYLKLPHTYIALSGEGRQVFNDNGSELYRKPVDPRSLECIISCFTILTGVNVVYAEDFGRKISSNTLVEKWSEKEFKYQVIDGHSLYALYFRNTVLPSGFLQVTLYRSKTLSLDVLNQAENRLAEMVEQTRK